MSYLLLASACLCIVFVVVLLKPDFVSGLFGGAGLSSTTQKEAVKKTGPTAPKVSTSIVDYVRSDDRRSKWKLVMFIIFPFVAYLLFPYPTTFIIAKISLAKALGAWYILGFSGYALVPFAAFEDDGGRKILNVLYKGIVLSFLLILLGALFAPEEYDYSMYISEEHPSYAKVEEK